MEEYSFDPEERARSNIELLKDGDLEEYQREFFREFISDFVYENSLSDENCNKWREIAEYVNDQGSPDVDWEYMQGELEKYIEKRVDRHNLEDYNPEGDEKIPRPEEDWNPESIMNIGAVDQRGNSYDDVWLTNDTYTQEARVEHSRIYLGEFESREYIEMMCNLGNEDEVQELVENAIKKGRDEIALSFAEILVDYNPGKVEELADEDLNTDATLNGKFLNMVEEKDQAEDLAEFLDRNTEFESS